MSVNIRNVTIYNWPLFRSGLVLLCVALILLLLPDSAINQAKDWGEGFGRWWFYAIEFSDLLFLAVAFFVIDKATKGTWWAKNVKH